MYDIEPVIPLIEAGYTLLTPNFRLARAVRSEWNVTRSASGDQVWQAPDIHALEPWLIQQWKNAVDRGELPLQLRLGGAQITELWQQVIAASERNKDAAQLLQPAAAARQAQSARDTLMRWQVDTAQYAVMQQFQFDMDCSTWLQWQRQFEERLNTRKLVTATDCIRQLLQLSSQQRLYKVALLDFDDVPALFSAALATLCVEIVEVQPRGKRAEGTARAAPDKATELQAAAHWACTVNRREPGASVAIVLPDMVTDKSAIEYFLRREFDCLGEKYTSLPVNFSAGMALDQVPVVRAALQALHCSGKQTPLDDIVALMQSRFTRSTASESALGNLLIKQLFEVGRKQIKTSDLRQVANDVHLGDLRGHVLGEILQQQAQIRSLRARATPGDWVPVLCEILDLWAWPGTTALDSLEYQQVELWYRVLEDMAAYDVICEPLPFSDFLNLLQRHCAQQVFQPQTADSKVQVLGVLEAAGLKFDYMWLSGMQAKEWPGPAKPNPFIPVALQVRLQMPHANAEREWAFVAVLMEQYMHSAAVVEASYTQQVDGVPELPSALLDDFDWQDPMQAIGVPGEWSERWQRRQIEAVDDSFGPPILAGELDQTRGGSGLIEDQSNCPFRAFAKHRLKSLPLAAVHVAISAADRGSVLHDALYALWGDLENSTTLSAMPDPELEEVIMRAVASALGEVKRSLWLSVDGSFWDIERKRLEQLLKEWLLVEKQREPFVVCAREESVELVVSGLPLRLRVDRIDQLDDGSKAVIDYKSGRSYLRDWLGERPPKPQLPLYIGALAETPGALTFAQVRSRDCKYVGLGANQIMPKFTTDIPKAVRGRMPAQDWDQLCTLWQEGLAALADGYLNGDAQVDPLSPGSCNWCGQQVLCRIGQQSVGAA